MTKSEKLKLDGLFSKFIRLRADGKCQHCGKEVGFKRLNCMHFISRRILSTRWDTENALAGCPGCHFYLDEHPYEKTDFFKKYLGSDKFEELCIRGNVITHGGIDRDALEAELKEKIKVLEG
jgi:hypothetical protein